MRTYKLVNKCPVPCDINEFHTTFGNIEARRVAYTQTEKWDVSTVFLGLDHNSGSGPPLLFETMVFERGDVNLHDRACWRWTTWDEAAAGHEKIVSELLLGIAPEEVGLP